MIYLLTGLGGVVGAISRYLIGVWMEHSPLLSFPFHTLLINLSGCFILSIFYTLADRKIKVHPYFRTAFGTGMIGAFTTFSTFCYESVSLIKSNHFGSAFLYIFFSMAGGYLCSALGAYLGSGNGKKPKLLQKRK